MKGKIEQRLVEEPDGSFTLKLVGGTADLREELALRWRLLHPKATYQHLGWLPSLVTVEDPRSAREQLDSNYAHGSGWRPFSGFVLMKNGNIRYSGDPPMQMIGETQIRDETVRLYEHAWVMILQKDGTFEVCRMD